MTKPSTATGGPRHFGSTFSLTSTAHALGLTFHAVLAKQELLHVREQELFRLGFANVQSVVVDQLLLGLEPLLPADIADLLVNPEADVILEGSEGKLVAFLAAASAEYVRHAGKITSVPNTDRLTITPPSPCFSVLTAERVPNPAPRPKTTAVVPLTSGSNATGHIESAASIPAIHGASGE
mgnify:CR=1 FL=1